MILMIATFGCIIVGLTLTVIGPLKGFHFGEIAMPLMVLFMGVSYFTGALDEVREKHFAERELEQPKVSKQGL